MITKEQVVPIVEEIIAGSGLFIVEVKCSASNEIEVVLDSPEAITIGQCADINRRISERLDREAEDFELTVASAGLSEPLKILPQYQKHLGKEVELILKNGQKVKGIMTAADETSVTVEYEKKVAVEGKKRKQLQKFTETYPLGEVKSTTLEIKVKR